LRCKRYKIDATKGFGQKNSAVVETHNWVMERPPPISDFWVFRTCHITGAGDYYSKQYPCNFTLRMAVRGKCTYRMRGSEWILQAGDIFAAFPGVPIEFREDKDNPFEWYEFQLDGPRASEILKLTGCSLDIPVRNIPKTKNALRYFHKLHQYYSAAEKKIFKALAIFYLLLDMLLPEDYPHTEKLTSPEALAYKVKMLLDNSHFAISQNVETLATRFDVDRSTLFRAFKKTIGISPKAYLQNIKLQRAKELLLMTNMPVSVVAHAAGFANGKYFINCFRKKIGTPPERWRKEQCQNKKESVT